MTPKVIRRCFKRGLCAHCHNGLEQETRRCPHCRIDYHATCWQEKRCRMPDCPQKPFVAKPKAPKKPPAAPVVERPAQQWQHGRWQDVPVRYPKQHGMSIAELRDNAVRRKWVQDQTRQEDDVDSFFDEGMTIIVFCFLVGITAWGIYVIYQAMMGKP